MSNRSKSKEEIEILVNNKGFDFLDCYIKDNKSRVIIKAKDGYVADMIVYVLSISKSVNFFHTHNPYTLQNISLWLKLNSKTFELTTNNIYVNASKNLKFYCYMCHEVFDMSWSNIFQNHGCSVCRGLQIRETTCLAYLRPKLIDEWVSSEHNLTPYDISEYSHEMVLWRCSECRNEWKTKVNSRTSMNSGCPKCNESKGEEKIYEYLKKNKIAFIRQHRFKDCKNKKTLPFDFYLIDYGILIEYDGQFHFKPININKNKEESIESFQKTKENDKIKNKYCLKNNLNLLRISYWDFDNIEIIIENYLKIK